MILWVCIGMIILCCCGYVYAHHMSNELDIELEQMNEYLTIVEMRYEYEESKLLEDKMVRVNPTLLDWKYHEVFECNGEFYVIKKYYGD